MMIQKNNALLWVCVAVATVVVALLPIAEIWALNVIFGLSIPYTFWTWLAGALLLLIIHVNVRVKILSDD